MNLYHSIRHLFPSATGRDFSVGIVDGKHVITRWELKDEQPSAEALEKAWEEVEARREKRAAIARITNAVETIFRDEFSDVSKAVLAATFAGLLELVRRGEFEAAKILIGGASTVPPGVTAERFAEVKKMLAGLFP